MYPPVSEKQLGGDMRETVRRRHERKLIGGDMRETVRWRQRETVRWRHERNS